MQFVQTRNNNHVLLFRNYSYQRSNVCGSRHYYRCQIKQCKARIILNDGKFQSCSGKHFHEPNAEEKLQKIEQKRQKMNLKKEREVNRMDTLRKREEERIKKAAEVAEKRAQKEAGKKKTSLSVDDIDNVQQDNLFNAEDFDAFGVQLETLFEQLSELGITLRADLEDLSKQWALQKRRVKSLASAKQSRRDKRFALYKEQIAQITNERDLLLVSKRDLEDKVDSLLSPQFIEHVNEVKRLISSSRSGQASTSQANVSADTSNSEIAFDDNAQHLSTSSDMTTQSVQYAQGYSARQTFPAHTQMTYANHPQMLAFDHSQRWQQH